MDSYAKFSQIFRRSIESSNISHCQAKTVTFTDNSP